MSNVYTKHKRYCTVKLDIIKGLDLDGFVEWEVLTEEEQDAYVMALIETDKELYTQVLECTHTGINVTLQKKSSGEIWTAKVHNERLGRTA